MYPRINKPQRIKVLFDANPLVNAQKSGVGYYTYGVVQALADTFPKEVQLIGHYYNFLGRKVLPKLPTARNITYHESRLIPGKAVNALRKVGLPVPFELLARARGDVLFFPNFTILPSLFGTPRFVTIHDLYYCINPVYIQQKNLKFLRRFVPKAIKKSAGILTISQTTAQDLQRFFHVPAGKVTVNPIPAGSQLRIPPKTAGELVKHLGIPGKFILFVGTIEPRKNITNLLLAYQQLPTAISQQYSLVLAGGKGWQDEEIVETLAATRAKGLAIIQTGYVSDEERAALYQNASLFVMPSLYEGFGMQLLEAASYELPMAISDLAVFKETMGNSAAYFNQTDPQDMARIIQALLSDTKLAGKNAHLATKKATEYSWHDVAQEIYAVFTANAQRR